MADPIYELKKLEETGGIKEYYETFDSIRKGFDLPEEFLLSWFIAGLRRDTRREVRSFRPQTVIQAYAYGRLYEIAYPKSLASTPLVSFPILVTQEDDDHVLQVELQDSDQKSHKELQDSDQSMPNSANTKEANSIDGLPRDKREEETDQESVRKCPDSVAHQVFDEISEIQEFLELVAHEEFDEIPLLKEHVKDDLLEVMPEPFNSDNIHLEEAGGKSCSLTNNFRKDAHQVFDGMLGKKVVKNSHLEEVLCADPSVKLGNSNNGVTNSLESHSLSTIADECDIWMPKLVSMGEFAFDPGIIYEKEWKSGLSNSQSRIEVLTSSLGMYFDPGFIEIVDAFLKAYEHGDDTYSAEASLLRPNDSLQSFIFDPGRGFMNGDSSNSNLSDLVDVIRISSVDGQDDLKVFNMNDVKDTIPLPLVKIELTGWFKMLNKLTTQGKMINGYVGVLCFDPGGEMIMGSGGYHNNLASLLYQVELYKLLSFLGILQSEAIKGMQLLVGFTMMLLPKIHFAVTSL